MEQKLGPHRLIACQVALELLDAVIAAQIRDPRLKDQAMRAAQSACLNIAEAAGRCGVKDRARVFMIAEVKPAKLPPPPKWQCARGSRNPSH